MTFDGVMVEALYTESAAPAFAQRTSGGWQTLALLDPRRGDLAQAVRRAWRFGARALWLRPGEAMTAEAVAELLSGLNDPYLVLAPAALKREAVLELLSELGSHPRLEFAWDPLSQAMSTDDWRHVESAYETAAVLLKGTRSDGADLTCSSLTLHAAGGDPVDELALLAAGWLELVRRLTAEGISAELAAEKTTFQMAAGGHLLTEIAKFRAAREVLARVMLSVGVRSRVACTTIFHAVTSPRTLAVRGHRNNALRASVQVTASVLGGADLITVLPWDDRLKDITAGSDRLALQLQNVLREEARLGENADPAAGSFAVESLTQKLGLEAWSLLATIEEEGGAWASLAEGCLRRRLCDARRRRRQQLAGKAQPVLGVSVYPDPHDPPATPGVATDGVFTPIFDDLVAAT